MTKPSDMIKCRTVSGEAVTVADITLTPQSQAVTVRWPDGGLVWNRPVAVLVERAGQTERIPIVDVTRVIQLGLFGLSLVFAMVTLILTIRSGRD